MLILINAVKLAAYRAVAYLYVNKNTQLSRQQLQVQAVKCAMEDIAKKHEIEFSHKQHVKITKLVREAMDTAYE